MIHAVYVAMAPVEAAFRQHWPEALRYNLTDDALSPDLEAAGSIDSALTERIDALASLAWRAGADAILYTCSAFGPAIEGVATRLPIPVLKPNEAMYEDALRLGRRIGMIATFAPAVTPMEDEFYELTRRLDIDATLDTLCVEEALVAAKCGDIRTHDRLVAEAAPKLAHCHAIMLAQFSTSTALASVKAVMSAPVLSSPEAAVLRLKHLLLETPVSTSGQPVRRESR